jgi:hypothetical protein
MRSRMGYMVNLVEHGPAEARMVADLMEERLTPTMSVAMNDLKEMLTEKRTSEMLNLVSKMQAEKALRAAEGLAPSGPPQPQ